MKLYATAADEDSDLHGSKGSDPCLSRSAPLTADIPSYQAKLLVFALYHAKEVPPGLSKILITLHGHHVFEAKVHTFVALYFGP